MPALNRTVFNEKHKDLGAIMINCSGWQMPGHYPGGKDREHLCVRYHAGLFDESHKGKLQITGSTAPYFLQHVLTNNAAALSDGQGQYTIIQTEEGFAVDNALLFRVRRNRYILCVNTVNRERVWEHLHREAVNFKDLYIEDNTFELALLCLQGPGSRPLLDRVSENAPMKEPGSKHPGDIFIAGTRVIPAHTADPALPERVDLFMDKNGALPVWEHLCGDGAEPVGMEARETLRVETAMPLFGHELGLDPQNTPIPIFAPPFAPSVVSFSLKKGDFLGKDALVEQFRAYERIAAHDFSDTSALPRMIRPLAVEGDTSANRGDEVHGNGKRIGFVTSGAMVPIRSGTDTLDDPRSTFGTVKRSLALALLDVPVIPGREIQVRIRDRFTDAVIVPFGRKKETLLFSSCALWNHALSAEALPSSKKSASSPISH